MISPYTADYFFTNHLFKLPLVVRKSDEDKSITSLLNIDAIDLLLNTVTWTYPDIRLCKNEEDIPPEKYTYTLRYLHENLDQTIDINKVIDNLLDNATIIINSIERYWNPIEEFCSKLESELGYSIHAKAVLVPPDSKVQFKMEDDGFIVNILGAGKFSMSNELDLEDHDNFNIHEKEEEINTGDSIYLPRNWRYIYNGGKEISIHILVLFHPPKWIDLFRLTFTECFKTLSNKVEYRQSLPIHQIYNNKYQEQIFNNLLADLESYFTINRVKQIAVENFLRSSIHHNKGRLINIQQSPDITFESLLKKNTLVKYTIIETDKEIILKFLGKDLIFPSRAKTSIKYILNNETFCASNIKGLLNIEGKLNLVKILIKEGLLSVQ